MTDAKQLGRDTGLLLNGNSAGSPSNNIEDLVVQEILSTNTYPFYVASDIKRSRLTKAEMEVIRAAITDILSKDNPQTVRQVFYQLVARGVIEKTEGEYKRTVIRLLSEMRLDDQIPWDWIVDESRRTIQTQTFDSIQMRFTTPLSTFAEAHSVTATITSRSGLRRRRCPASSGTWRASMMSQSFSVRVCRR